MTLGTLAHLSAGALRRRLDLRAEAQAELDEHVYADVVRYRELLGNLFRRDLQAKYRGSALGVLWTVANPVMLMGVYLLVFGVVWKSQFSNGGHYPLFLLTGLARLDVLRRGAAVVDALDARQREPDPQDALPAPARAALGRRSRISSASRVMLVLLLVVNFIALPRVRATEWLAIPLAVLVRRPRLRARARRRVAQRALPRRRVHRRGAARAVVLPDADPLSARRRAAREAPPRRRGHPLGRIRSRRRSRRSARRSSAARCRSGRTRSTSSSRAAVALALGAFVFTRVDDQIAIEV